MIKAIKSFYRANVYRSSKPIRPGSFSEGYFMKKSSLAKKTASETVTFSKFIAKGWENLIYRIGAAMDNLARKHK